MTDRPGSDVPGKELMWYALRLAGDGRRLALQGGVRLDGTRVESVDCIITPGGQVLQVGKRRFVCLVPPS